MGKFCLFWTELSACNTSIFYFQDNNLSKSQWIFMCIDIVEISFGIAHCQILTELSAHNMIMAGYHHFIFYLQKPSRGESVFAI